MMYPEAKPFLSEEHNSSVRSSHDSHPAYRPSQKSKWTVQFLAHSCLIILYTIIGVTVVLSQESRQLSSLHRNFIRQLLLPPLILISTKQSIIYLFRTCPRHTQTSKKAPSPALLAPALTKHGTNCSRALASGSQTLRWLEVTKRPFGYPRAGVTWHGSACIMSCTA